MKLRRFQREFLKRATCASGRRCGPELAGARLTAKVGWPDTLAERIITPGDALFRPGTESVIIASSARAGAHRLPIRP